MINPARIRIIAVGKVRKGWVSEGVETYRKRLPGLEIVELKDGGMAREAEAISAELRGGEQLVALCEEGQSYDSLAFAKALEGSGSGTGVLVTYNGTDWKIVGTNVTVSAV